MSVEVSGEVAAIRYVDVMLAEEAAEPASKHTLTHTASATKDKRDLAGATRPLNAVRHPTEDIVEQALIARADVVSDVVPEEGPVALLGFDREAAPEVVATLELARGIEADAAVLTPGGVLQPVLPQRRVLMLAPTKGDRDMAVRIEILEAGK